MKKYLKLLFVALFATLTFAFTACGDDEDEPNFGKGIVGELTVNGAKVSFTWIDGGDWEDMDNYQADMMNATNSYYIFIGESVNKLTTGQSVKDLGFMFGIGGVPYNKVVSGDVIVEKKESNSITLKFNNLELGTFYKDNIIINGTIKLPINGEYGSYV